MRELTKESFEFRDFRLDVAERQLLLNGLSVPLTPKAFDVLAVLVQRSGRLVEKDELLRLVWDDAFVEESNIARIVHTLRRTLGEKEDKKFIETVAKRGYRFVAKVEAANGSLSRSTGIASHTKEIAAVPKRTSPQGDENGRSNVPKMLNGSRGLDGEVLPNDQASGRDHRQRGQQWIIFVGILLAAVVVTIGFVLTRPNPIAKDPAVNKSLAILPLRPINEENRDAVYELGIAESLIVKLSVGNGLMVRPLSATRVYRQIDENPTTAGQEQKVDYVLSSNYQVADGKIRVTAQLIDVESGAVAGVFKSEHDFSNVFQMQDQVANDIGNNLLTQFGSRQNGPKNERGTENEAAYRLFLQAEYIFDQVDKEDVGRAIGYLENAVKLDPNYARAYAALAYAYRHMGKGIVPAEEQYLRSKAAIERALELDPDLAEAHAVLGMVKSTAEADFVGAEAEYKRAVELDPRSTASREMYAMFLTSTGRFDEGLDQIRIAQQLEPASISHDLTYGQILYYAHRYPEATDRFKGLLEKNKDVAYGYFWIWLLYDLQGNDAEAYEWFVKYKTQIKTPPEVLRTYQVAYDKSGWKGVLREQIIMDRKNLAPRNASVLNYEMACFSARLGDRENALKYLSRAYEERGFVTTLTKVDPYLDSLHGDARFDDLVRRIGLV